MDRLRLASVIKGNKASSIYRAIFVFILLIGISNCKIQGYSILSVGILFTLVLIRYSVYVSMIAFFLGSIISSCNITTIIFSSFTVIAILVYDMIRDKKIFKKNNVLLYMVYGVVNAIFILIYYSDIVSLVTQLLVVIFGILYLYICTNFFTSCVGRGFSNSINIDEKICGAIVLVSFIIGICEYRVYGIDIASIISIFLVLVATHVFSGTMSLYLGVIIGIGYSISYVNPVYISLFALITIVSIAFKSNYKILSTIAVVVVDIVFNIYFVDYYSFHIASFVGILISSIIFQCTPLVIFESIIDVMCDRQDKVILIDVLNRSKASICSRIKDISHVFARMDSVFRQMVRGGLSNDAAIRMVKEDIYHKMCAHCDSRGECVHIPTEIGDDVLSHIVSIAFSKGKISVLDIPQNVASRCNAASLVATINRVMADFKGYYDIVKNMDSSKLLIASQLNGVSRLLNNIADEVNVNITFDIDREKHIIEELSYKNIIAHECLVYEKDINTLVVNVIISNTACNKRYLEKVISKCCNSRLHIVSVEPTEINNAVLVTLATLPNYDIVFGTSSVSKDGNTICGDNHSLIKIDDSRYMIAICDGMGSGDKAHSISSLTLSLVENYYKAGFDDDVILGSINKLLLLSEEDCYSTIDLCVLDLRKNKYSFIKLGATISFVKNKNTTIEIEGSGLPVGILEDIKPHVITRNITEFDTIIMCSDGVVDSFGKTSIREYINSLDIVNPKTLADTILHKAISNYGGYYKDDMTVLAVRIFPT